MTAMRSKGEHGARMMHREFSKVYPDLRVSFLVFSLACESFNSGVVEQLLDGQVIYLPFRMGQLYVEKRQVNYNHLKLDYGHYRKTGEKLFHTNRHSDGFQAYYHWRKLTCNIPHKGIYKFIPARAVSRALAAAMKQPGGHKLYQEFDPYIARY